jgi:hypothetical protein
MFRQVGVYTGNILKGASLRSARHMAAERHRAAALDRTHHSWSRLTRPALARRHGAPWSRKILARRSNDEVGQNSMIGALIAGAAGRAPPLV